MFDRGASQAEVAQALEVSRESASRWYATWYDGGTAALAEIGRRGRTARLTTEQLVRVEAALLKGAVANGFPNDVWTAPRVAKVIEELTGERYHPGHVWRILRQMGWSVQRPARRAVERDDEAIEAWIKTRWPKVKETPAGGAPGSSSKTSRASH